jgi:transcriptional regulator with XRE-family HTH domain
MNLAARIRRARRHVGLSQSALAQRLGVHRSCVGHWEGVSNANPRHDRLADVAKLCVVSYEWLATGRGQMKLGHDPLDDVPAALGMLVDDPQALRLLGAWEAMSSQSRMALLSLVEELASLRQPKRRRPSGAACAINS